jgi:hypothetical protein
VFEKTLEVSVPECSSDRLLISDLEPSFGVSPLGRQSRSNPFAKGNLLVNPYPFEQFSVSRASTFYFEVYNLLIGPNGRTDYRVEYELCTRKGKFLEKLNPFQRETTALSTEFRQTGERRDEQVYFSLDFSRVKPGDYTLEITVTDQVSGEARKAEMALRLVE